MIHIIAFWLLIAVLISTIKATIAPFTREVKRSPRREVAPKRKIEPTLTFNELLDDLGRYRRHK